MVTPLDPYFEHFDGYLELVEEDFSLFHDRSTLANSGTEAHSA